MPSASNTLTRVRRCSTYVTESYCLEAETSSASTSKSLFPLRFLVAFAVLVSDRFRSVTRSDLAYPYGVRTSSA